MTVSFLIKKNKIQNVLSRVLPSLHHNKGEVIISMPT